MIAPPQRVLLERGAMWIVPPLRRLVSERDDLTAEVERLRHALQSAQSRTEESGRQPGQSTGPRTEPAPVRGREPLSYLFIVTYGRSGSTLLQGILCSTPGVLIRGENGGVMSDLYRIHTRTSMRKRREADYGSHHTEHPWFGIESYPEDVAVQYFHDFVVDTLIRPLPESRVVGFKEIRWGRPDLDGFVSFIDAVFPRARFIVNTRDAQEVARSRFWARRPDALPKIERLNRRFTALAEALGERGFLVHYNDYAGNPQALRQMFEWLGEHFDPLRVEAVMSKRHSY
jgi:hypothetical protein